MTPDLLNAGFELTGAVFTWLSVLRVYRDKGYAGIYVPAIVFFFCWGFWNIFYYWSLHQSWSWTAGLFLCSANLAWVSLMVYYGPVQRRDW